VGEKKPKPPLVQKLAEKFIVKLHLTPRNPEGVEWTPRGLYEAHASDVRKLVRNMSPGRLGTIGVQGKRDDAKSKCTSLYQVHGEDWLKIIASGRSLAREIALTTLIATMFDILRARPPSPRCGASGDEGRATLRDARHSRLERDPASQDDPPSPAAGFGGHGKSGAAA
jgi:hypothetical protein